MSEESQKSKMIGLSDDYDGDGVDDYKKDDSSRVRFFVRLCSDVLLEVLGWGDRRRLALLEKFGRRFHWFIDGRFKEKPFLLFDLHITPCQLIHISGREISQADLLAIPSFIRFKTAEVNYVLGSEQNKEKCDWVPMLLQPIKESMNGSKIKFRAEIDHRRMSNFNDHETLLEYIGNELLPIWDNCRSYEFDISINLDNSDFSSVENIIEKILQFGPISGCSNVSFDFTLWRLMDGVPVYVELPIEAVANWLSRSRNYDTNNLISKNHKEKKEKERILEINTNGFINKNCLQILINNLKKSFCEAILPTQPFTLRMDCKSPFILLWKIIGTGLEVVNGKTGEKLSIISLFGSGEIKRSGVKKIKENVSNSHKE